MIYRKIFFHNWQQTQSFSPAKIFNGEKFCSSSRTRKCDFSMAMFLQSCYRYFSTYLHFYKNTNGILNISTWKWSHRKMSLSCIHSFMSFCNLFSKQKWFMAHRFFSYNSRTKYPRSKILSYFYYYIFIFLNYSLLFIHIKFKIICKLTTL